MTTVLTIAAFLALIAAGAYVIHRLNTAHGERIASRSYSRFLSGRPAADDPAAGTAAPSPTPSSPSSGGGRRDRRDGGRGRFRPRRHRERTAHNKPTGGGS